jgi:hypothetical protein
LHQLIDDGPPLGLNVYVVKYSSISQALVINGEMSSMRRCRKFLESLSGKLRDKAFEFCATKDWKLSPQDTDANIPNFEELKPFILDKALAEKKRMVFNKERTMEGYDDLKESAAILPTM